MVRGVDGDLALAGVITFAVGQAIDADVASLGVQPKLDATDGRHLRQTVLGHEFINIDVVHSLWHNA